VTLDYNKVWKTLNELESVTSKICSVREILDSALDALENHKKDKAEALMYAADEYLKYYLEEFDSKFKDAWKETVVKLNSPLTCDKDDTSPKCKGAWNSFWEENYYPDEYKTYKEAVSAGYKMTADGFWIKENEEHNMPPWGHSDMEALSQQKEDKVVKWRLPVEMDPSGEYFIQFPDDLLDAADLKEGDKLEWVDFLNGTFILRKTTEPLGMDEC
jgi:hypothetical protein